MVVEEETLSLVKLLNLTDFIRRELEIEDVEILLHALIVDGLGNDDHALFYQEAQARLSYCLTVLLTDGSQYGIGLKNPFRPSAIGPHDII